MAQLMARRFNDLEGFLQDPLACGIPKSKQNHCCFYLLHKSTRGSVFATSDLTVAMSGKTWPKCDS